MRYTNTRILLLLVTGMIGVTLNMPSAAEECCEQSGDCQGIYPVWRVVTLLIIWIFHSLTFLMLYFETKLTYTVNLWQLCSTYAARGLVELCRPNAASQK